MYLAQIFTSTMFCKRFHFFLQSNQIYIFYNLTWPEIIFEIRALVFQQMCANYPPLIFSHPGLRLAIAEFRHLIFLQISLTPTAKVSSKRRI